MILSHEDISHFASEAPNMGLVVYPFDADNVGPNSLDVRLGRWIYTPPRYRKTGGPLVLNPYNEDSVRRYWGEPLDIKGTSLVLPAGMSILGHTEEFIGTSYAVDGSFGLVATMYARSSVGRSNILVCKCAGFGDVGYFNRWTMEITNIGEAPVVLPYGMKIAQLAFDVVYTSEPDPLKYTGKYSSATLSARPWDTWTPSDMLPRLYLDPKPLSATWPERSEVL